MQQVKAIDNHTSSNSGDFLKSVQLFGECTDKEVDLLLEGHILERCTKGKMLFVSGDNAERYYVIKNGWVKIFRETLDGAQAIIDILTEGHTFGETSIFEENTYPYSAEVVEPSEILSLSLRKLRYLIENNPKFALSMLSSMARYRRQQDTEIEHRSLQNAPQRIGCFILRLLPNQNEAKGRPITIHLPYDKTLIASRLGMQPETFSRALSKLKDATGINIKGSTLEIQSIDPLIDFSCSACTSEFPCKDLGCKSCV